MLLALRLAGVEQRAAHVEVSAWHVGVGDPLAFGQELVTLVVRSTVLLHRAQSARDLFEAGETRALDDDVAAIDDADRLLVVRCADPGVLVRIDADAGVVVANGDVLGLIGTSTDDVVDGGDGATFPDARLDLERVDQTGTVAP